MRKGLHYTLGYTLKITRSILRKSVKILSFLFLLPYAGHSLAAAPLISAGQDRTFALMSDGRIISWGNTRNVFGYDAGVTPPAFIVDSSNNIVTGNQSIAAGSSHALALKDDGTLLGWGNNSAGQLAHIVNDLMVDTNGNPFTDIQTIVAGYSHTLALKDDGTLLVWGHHFFQQPSSIDHNRDPVVVDSSSNPTTDIQAIAAGNMYSVVLKTDGTLLAWGTNISLQLGTLASIFGSVIPLPVVDTNGNPITNIQGIAAGRDHTLALKVDGSLLAWGQNDSGKIGDGSYSRAARISPVSVVDDSSNPITGIQAIAAGRNHSLALKTDGTLLAWGNNAYGQLGNGTNTGSNTPVVVMDSNNIPITGIQAITAGDYHNIALKTDGTLLAWGDNSQKQLGDSTTTNRSNPVVVVDDNNKPLNLFATTTSQDFNGDGKSDVLWLNNADQRLWMYLMNDNDVSNGDGSGEHLAYTSTLWNNVGYGDFNIDGKEDMLWRHSTTGENAIWLMNGTTTPIVVTLTLPSMTSPAWKVGGVADFDGDGHVDIFWHHDDGENRITFMNGTTEVSTVSVNTIVDPEWTVSGIADFNNDGKADVLWRNSVNRRVWLYLMDGSTIINGAGEGEHVAYTSANWDIEGLGDFDADGQGDILWRHNTNGRVWMYLMNGPAVTNGSSSAPGEHVAYTSLTWDIDAIGDYDGDGKQDIFWRNNITGQNHMYRMNGPTLKQAGGTAVNTLSDLNWAVNN